MRQPVRLGVEVRVGERPFFVHHRRRIGRLLDLIFKELMKAAAARVRRACPVPLHYNLLALLRRQDLQLLDGEIFSAHHPCQQLLPIAQIAFDGAGLEQTRRINHRAGNAVADF